MIWHADACGSWLSGAKVAEISGGRLLRNGCTASRITTDSRTVRGGECFVAIAGPSYDGHDFVADAMRAGAAGAVVSRHVADLPEHAWLVLVPDTRLALQRLAGEHRRTQSARVIGITGSCGKTSTKDMLGTVLQSAMPTVASPRSFNNEIGVPLTLLAMTSGTRAAVVEIGSNSPGEIERLARIARPDIAIVTCVAESHLQALGSVDGVAREKSFLVSMLGSDGLAILNGDDPNVAAMARATTARQMLVRLDRRADWFATEVRFCGLGTTFLLQGERPVTIPRLGSHNVYNALFAIAAATELGMSLDQILAGLATIPPTQRRLECKVAGAIAIFDDTYNMNPGSARAALRAIAGLPQKGRKIVVFGEMLELGAHSDELHRRLGDDVARAQVDLLMVVGEGAAPIVDGAVRSGMAARTVLRAQDPIDALEQLLQVLRAGDAVLCKASRGVKLERLVDGLLQRLPDHALGSQSCDGLPPLAHLDRFADVAGRAGLAGLAGDGGVEVQEGHG